MNVSMRIRAQKWAIVLAIFFGVPALLIWAVMPYLDLSRASYLATTRNYQQAIDTLDRAIQFNSSIPDTYTRRGWLYQQLGKPDKALEDFATAIKINPQTWDAYNNRAWLKYETGDMAEALKDAELAVSNGQSCPQAFDTRGTILLAKGESERALSDFNSAISLNSTYAPAYFHRSQCLEKAGVLAPSKRDAQMAADLGYSHD